MGLNTVLNILLIFVGAPGSIYVLSNVGYVGSFVPVLLGYYFLRRWRPEVLRPFRLPEWMKYGAIALASSTRSSGSSGSRRARSRDASSAAARCS